MKVRPKAKTKRRAAVMVEYAFLLLTVAIPTVAGLTATGRVMLRQYKLARDTILSPFP